MVSIVYQYILKMTIHNLLQHQVLSLPNQLIILQYFIDMSKLSIFSIDNAKRYLHPIRYVHSISQLQHSSDYPSPPLLIRSEVVEGGGGRGRKLLQSRELLTGCGRIENIPTRKKHARKTRQKSFPLPRYKYQATPCFCFDAMRNTDGSVPPGVDKGAI